MVAESWTWEEEKAFENAVAVHCETCSDWLEKVDSALPGKTFEEVKNHYEILLEDVASIESGRVALPNYDSSSSSADAEGSADGGGNGKKGGCSYGNSGQRGKGARSDLERRKGIAWTEEEHRLFLLGLEKYGKGDWRSISRNFVISRTPTQVASHAQKYFIRQNSMNKDRRRSSIHDITRVNNDDAAAPQGPITGQGTSTEVGPGKAKQPSLAHAVATPVAGPPMVYGLRIAPGAVVPCAPACVSHITYPIPNASSHR